MPTLKAAAVELAEYHQGRGRFIRWLPAITIVFFGAAAIFFAFVGETTPAILNAVVALTGVGQFLVNPATRPKNVARSLEASRRVVALGSDQSA